MKPIARMLIGTIFERGGRSSQLVSKGESVAHVSDQETAASLTMPLDAVGTVKVVPEVCFFAPSSARGAS